MRRYYSARKVWIKRYLMEQLGISERQLYRLLAGDYSAKTVGQYIRDRGYLPPLDRRTKAARSAKQAPPDESPRTYIDDADDGWPTDN